MFNPDAMTEEAWLTGDDPGELMEVAVARGWVSPRKLRLWACACCRRIWPLLVSECSRRAVEVAERFADGLATEAERAAACDSSLAELTFADDGGDRPEAVGWGEAAFAASDAVDVGLADDQYEFVYRTTGAV